MEKIIIHQAHANQRLDKFLLKRYPQLKMVDIYKHLKKNNLKVNQKKVLVSYILQTGDEIKLFFDPLQTRQIPIIYEDEHLLIVNKPCGVESHNSTGKADLISILKTQTDISTLVAVHRLDTNTTGLVMVAKNETVAQWLMELLKTNQISKYYQALVYGHLQPTQATLLAYLHKDEQRGLVTINETKTHPLAKEIITKYRVLEEFKKYSLVEIELLTGRTHQIRAHFNFIHHPIVGEKKYITKSFDEDTRFKTQALTAYKLKFHIDANHPLAYLNAHEIKLSHIPFLDKLQDTKRQ